MKSLKRICLGSAGSWANLTLLHDGHGRPPHLRRRRPRVRLHVPDGRRRLGLSSLYPLLYRQNYLEGLCAGEVEEGQCAERSLTKCCTSQLVRLSLVSSIAFFTVDAVAVLWGEFADRRGARARASRARRRSAAPASRRCAWARAATAPTR